MSFGFSPTDVLTLTKAAIDLYNKGWKVAKGAPRAYQALVEELLIYKKILWNFQVKLSRDDLADDRTARAAFEKSVVAFYSFQPLVEKYQKLGKLMGTTIFARLKLQL